MVVLKPDERSTFVGSEAFACNSDKATSACSEQICIVQAIEATASASPHIFHAGFRR